MRFVCNLVVSLVRFWCLFVSKKDAKQCCDVTKIDCPHCAGRRLPSPTCTMSTVDLCGVTALFGIFLESNKHQNLMRLNHLVTNKHHNLRRHRDLIYNEIEAARLSPHDGWWCKLFAKMEESSVLFQESHLRQVKNTSFKSLLWSVVECSENIVFSMTTNWIN